MVKLYLTSSEDQMMALVHGLTWFHRNNGTQWKEHGGGIKGLVEEAPQDQKDMGY